MIDSQTKLFLRVVGLIILSTLLAASHVQASDRKRQRLELATTFHPADPLFGAQLKKLMAIAKKNGDKKTRFRYSRKTRGASAAQTVHLLNAGSIEGVLLDPTGLGYRPALAQVFGGIPFGPKAARIVSWAQSDIGRRQLATAFQSIGAHVLLCGHSDRASGVFSRDKFIWPTDDRTPTVHSRGLANDVYKKLKFATRPLPGGDLYMGYASGVVNLLVSVNPSMDARAGFGQVSDHFYFPSWERSSAFALLLISQQKWQALSSVNQQAISNACKTLNRQPVDIDSTAAVSVIARQGAGNTIVEPWPPQYLAAARQLWKDSATEVVLRHPALGPIFEALNIP